MSRRSQVFLVLVCLLALPATVVAQADSLTADLAVLRSAGLDTDGPSLLNFFKKRTMADALRTKIANLIRQLGADEYSVREKASNDLVDIGAPARALLTNALRQRDLEVRRRARWALDKIGPASSEAHLLPAAARVLAQRKVAGSAEVLLNFLPNVEEPEVAEEVARCLALVAIGKDGKPEAAVLLALSDRNWLKRFAAADALARVGGKDQRPAVRKLLKDADAGVRRRVALALLEAKDKEAIPALIALLAATSSEDASAAEEALNAVAGDKAPPSPEDDTAAAREKYRKAWDGWWKDAGDKLDLAKVDLGSVGRGFTLLTLLDNTGNTGRVQQWDSSGKVRWTLSGLRYPVHASMTRRDRVLICEYYGNRVTERDLKGKVLFDKTITGQQILSAQRLANGNTFIAARNLLVEVDRTGKEVKSITRPYDVIAAHRHKDGKITIITTGQQLVRLDKDGKQTNSFNVGFVSAIVGLKPHFLPKGGVIVPDYSQGRVREYDASGKMVREHNIGFQNRPTSVTRLPNGNLLIGTNFRKRIFEIDKDGKEVSSKTTDGRPIFVDRR
jgi:hypothetical protein